MQAPTDSRHTERAFTMIEITIVMVLVAIMVSIGVMALKGTRDNGGRVELRAAARLYADAVERFQTDHGRNTPELGSADWPTATKGPVHRLSIAGATSERSYLQNPVPDVLARTGPNSARFADAAVSDGGTLIYVRSGALQFRVEAWWDGELMCVAGDVPPGEPAC